MIVEIAFLLAGLGVFLWGVGRLYIGYVEYLRYRLEAKRGR